MSKADPDLFAPTFQEMRDPGSFPENLREAARIARSENPLDPINLFNVHWKDDLGQVMFLVLPQELTGVAAPIAVLTGNNFPTGAHKVGPAYAMVVEKQAHGEIVPGKSTLLFQSSGNLALAGAWVGPRMGFRTIVMLPESAPRDRYEKVRAYGAEVITTPGIGDGARDAFDDLKEHRDDPSKAVIDQNGDFGNYRFHATVTAQAVEEVAQALARQGIGLGRPAAFVAAIGSAGTIGAGDPLKEKYGTAIVGLEPIQCSTLFNAAVGAHRIEGIGKRHVTWIHNALNMDALICVDDLDTIRGLALIQEGAEWLVRDLGVPEESAARMLGTFGVSGVCNILGSIKAVKHFGFGQDDVVVTVASDGSDRYAPALRWLATREGSQDRDRALRRIEIFHRAAADWVLEGRHARERWHNQKFHPWVERQGRSFEALQMQRSPDFWREQRARAADIDARILALRA